MRKVSERRLGQIEKRGDRYRARVTVGYKADGTRRNVSKTFDTRREANTWIYATAFELGSDCNVSAGVTLDSLWETYKGTKGEKLTKATMENYAMHMRNTWLPLLGERDVTLLTPSTVQRELDKMTHHNARIARSTISSVLTWAAKVGLISKSPIAGHVFEYPEIEGNGDDWDEDPFGTAEGARDVWSPQTVIECFERIQGAPLEPAWLMCVGGGLRIEEALAIRGKDVRRIKCGDRMLTQVAVHHAITARDGRKQTKTKHSVRVVGMVDPMGERLWELAQECEPGKEICRISGHAQNARWKNMFREPPTSPQRKAKWTMQGRLNGLPYIPLSRMRATHVTMMAEAGVSDNLNALLHGHTREIERSNYLSPDASGAAARVSDHLKLVV